MTPVSALAHFAFRIRLASAPSASVQSMVIGFVTNAKTTGVVGITLNAGSGPTQVYEQTFSPTGASTGYKGTSLSRSLTPGVFHDVDMKVTFDTSPAKITVMIDGVLGVQKDSELGLTPSSAAQMQAGAVYSMPTPELTFDIDDVIIETK